MVKKLSCLYLLFTRIILPKIDQHLKGYINVTECTNEDEDKVAECQMEDINLYNKREIQKDANVKESGRY